MSHNPEWLVEWLNSRLNLIDKYVFLLPPERDDLGETEDDDEWLNAWLNQQARRQGWG